jgi:4-hydroxybenzoate polyprenyltransferase
MYKLKAFFKLLRLNNLVIIVLTQFLFQYAVVYTMFHNETATAFLPHFLFAVLVIASVCIAAGGYIINDYFDVNIDLINKPQRTFIETTFSRRMAIKLHFVITFIGMVATGFVAYNINNWWLLAGNLLSVFLLIFYSISLKRQPLVGNFIVSILIAYTLCVLVFVQLHILHNEHEFIPKFLRIAGAYIIFSFITTLAREAIKDLEDLEGDRKDGCKTLPIVYGVPVAKMYSAILLVGTLILLFAIGIYAYWLYNFWPLIYIIIFVAAPCIYCIKILYQAKSKVHFALASRWLKIVMLMGILSMLFFTQIN